MKGQRDEKYKNVSSFDFVFGFDFLPGTIQHGGADEYGVYLPGPAYGC